MLLNIAHRGACKVRPENSLEAFREALRLGAHGVELDVRRCASGELVVIHDATLRRTVQGKGRVATQTLQQLQGLALKGGGAIPTLEEALLCLGPERYCFIELKDAKAALDAAEMMMQFIEKGYDKQKLILISFDHKALSQAKYHFPAITVGMSFKRLTNRCLAKARKLGADYITPNYRAMQARDIEAISAAGVKTVVWTVNTAHRIARMKKLGVDGIMTDYPERI